jgi:hypothetical protein
MFHQTKRPAPKKSQQPTKPIKALTPKRPELKMSGNYPENTSEAPVVAAKGGCVCF